MAIDVLGNPNDPLHELLSEPGKELFRKLGEVSHGFSRDAVLDAAGNILLNAVRQMCDNRAAAEKEFDDIFGKLKYNLLELHYDSTGKRRNVFPFTQTVKFGL